MGSISFFLQWLLCCPKITCSTTDPRQHLHQMLHSNVCGMSASILHMTCLSCVYVTQLRLHELTTYEVTSLSTYLVILPLSAHLFVVVFFFWQWELNSQPCSCWAGAYAAELHPWPISLSFKGYLYITFPS